MKIVPINSNNLNIIFDQLQHNLGGTLEHRAPEHILKVDNDIAIGEITGSCFKNHICFMEYDLVFREDTLVQNTLSATNTIHFMYCAKGNLTHSFGPTGKKVGLEQFQTGIFSSRIPIEANLFFKKDDPVKFSNIAVSTSCEEIRDGNAKDLCTQLSQLFKPQNAEETFSYTGSYNLRIAEYMQQLEDITEKGLIRNLLMEGFINLILAQKIQQHQEDLNSAKNNSGSLNKAEMDDIKELSEFIKNYPEIQYNLRYLSLKSGLSPAKLQEGFKLLHNRTVTNYIRNIRVEAAEHMIKTTNLNISEIVYSVGLTSRSYFSKIFKERYNCSPKFYQDHQHTIAEIA